MNAWEETRQERLDFADFLATLDDADWDSMTPAHDWRVRDVVGHVIQGATQSTMSTVIGLTSYRARYNAYYDAQARKIGAATPTELIARVRLAAPSQQRLLFLPGPKAHAMLTETFQHHQSVRHHLGRHRPIPEVRLLVALDAAKNAGFPIGVRKRIAGLRLRATDVSWQTGNGPEVRGPGEALFFAMLKDRILIDQLDGEGLTQLTASF